MTHIGPLSGNENTKETVKTQDPNEVVKTDNKKIYSKKLRNAMMQSPPPSAESQPEAPGAKTGGVVFGDGVLKKLETRETRVKDSNGIFTTQVTYVATLSDGTVVEYPLQTPIVGKKGSMTYPSVNKNKDGSIDFAGLTFAKITDTKNDDLYNVMGCSFTKVAANRGKDEDVINGGAIRHADGTILANRDLVVDYNKGDSVSRLSSAGASPKKREHDGTIAGTAGHSEMSLKNIEGTYSRDEQKVENGRTRVTTGKYGGDEKTKTYSHDNKLLKESYVNATEKVLADGYKVKTSPDGKEQWFYTPDGEQISKEEFRNRGLN